MATLQKHFTEVIDGIVTGTWRHFSLGRDQKGSQRFFFDKKLLEKKLILDLSPRCFLLQANTLRQRLSDTRTSVVTAFHRFDFASYVPPISNVFGPEFVLSQGSGIEELFPSKKTVGRPRKRSAPPLSSSVGEILLQARDRVTKASFVFVIWQGRDPKDACWVPLLSLPDAKVQEWKREAEINFPLSILI